MNKTLFGIAICVASPFIDAAESAGSGGAASAAQHISQAGSQAPSPGPANYFTGNVRVEPLFPADSAIDASAAYVTFEPGARSAWHTHPAGQRLVVTSGIGLTQEWGKPVQHIHPGDVVVCPPGVKHWHGASAGSAMTHMAITGSVDGKAVQWLEKVSDEQYNAGQPLAKQSRGAHTDALSAKQQSIVLIAAATATSDMPKLETALHHALDAGLTISEAKEILVQLMPTPVFRAASMPLANC